MVKKQIDNHKIWLLKSKKKFKKRFSYKNSFSSYKTLKKPEINLRCNKHNHNFKVSPYNHLRFESGGCINCKKENQLILSQKKVDDSKIIFFQWFYDNHSERLKIVSDFQGMTKPLSVYCRIHKKIKIIKPSYFFNNNSYACNDCANEASRLSRRLLAKNIEKEIKKKLPNSVKIKKIEFNKIKGMTEIILFCDEHKIQKPRSKNSILRSPYGCIDCGKMNRGGYAENKLKKLIKEKNKGSKCSIAVMEVEVFDIKALKVGVTTRTLKKRYLHHLKKIFYEISLFEADAYVIENKIKRKFILNKDERILKKGMRVGKRWPGDTEIYEKKKKNNIISLIKKFAKDLKVKDPDYKKELKNIVIPVSFPVSVGREKGVFQKSIPVVGVDPKTNEVLFEFKSMMEAKKMGFTNISSVISNRYPERQLSKGLRFFKKENFNPEIIKKLKIKNNGKPVKCIETNELFYSGAEAIRCFNEKGYRISKIYDHLSGKREHVQGFTFEYIDLPDEDSVKKSRKSINNYTPKENINAKKRITLALINNPKIIKNYKSYSDAAKDIGSYPSNISRAKLKNYTIKGYKVLKD